MSNENINIAEVSKTNENENKTNASEQVVNMSYEELVKRNKELVKENEELQDKLDRANDDKNRYAKYWHEADCKVMTLKKIFRALPISDYMTAKELISSIADHI